MSAVEQTADAPSPGHQGARMARGAIEEALFALPDVALEFDRSGVKDRLLKSISFTYSVLDSSVLAAVHIEGLAQSAALVGETMAMLTSAGDRRKSKALNLALDRLALAQSALRGAEEQVARIQMSRRDELVSGRADAGPPTPRRFRASRGMPELFALARFPLLPHVVVAPRVDIPKTPALPVVFAPPTSAEELAAFAEAAATGELLARFTGKEDASPTLTNTLTETLTELRIFEPAPSEVDMLRDIARDCLEDIANFRTLRKPNPIEGWLDQAPFEQRLLDNIDAFAAIGGPALNMISLFVAEAKSPDPERAFAAALTLGSIEGVDTVAAAIMTLKQSAPETYPGWIEGFWLAPSPMIDSAMVELLSNSRAPLVALALEVLVLRGTVPDEAARKLINRKPAAFEVLLARALATALPREEAIDHLERTMMNAPDDALFLAAAESMLGRRNARTRDLLKSALGTRPEAAACLLALCGRATELDTLLAVAKDHPSPRLLRALGRFGHAGAVDALARMLTHEDEEVVGAAAEALERITGANLRETVEEAWVVDLPPEALEGGIPIPTRKVERIVRDPAAWMAWLNANRKNLDPKIRWRGGRPFSPSHIVHEIEVAPPDRRAEAALELTAYVGRSVPFFTDDWVQRQQKHIAELRELTRKLDVPEGIWFAGLTAAAPAPPISKPGAPAALVETLGFTLPEALRALPFVGGAMAPPPARASSPTQATPEKEAATAPPEASDPPKKKPAKDLRGTALAFEAPLPQKGQPLPFGVPPAPPPPPSAKGSSPGGEAPAKTHDLRGTAFSFESPMPKQALPFEARGEGPTPPPPTTAPKGPPPPAPSRPGTASGLKETSAISDIQSILAALPFAKSKAPETPEVTSPSAAPAPAETPKKPEPPAPSPSRPGIASGLKETSAVSDIQSILAALPFAKSKAPEAPTSGEAPPKKAEPPPAPPSGPGSLLAGTKMALPVAKAPALPFASDAAAKAPAPPASSPGRSSAPVQEGGYSIEQYASLCVELATDPKATDAVLKRYQLTAEQRATLDQLWQARFARDPATWMAWDRAYKAYAAFMKGFQKAPR